MLICRLQMPHAPFQESGWQWGHHMAHRQYSSYAPYYPLSWVMQTQTYRLECSWCWRKPCWLMQQLPISKQTLKSRVLALSLSVQLI